MFMRAYPGVEGQLAGVDEQGRLIINNGGVFVVSNSDLSGCYICTDESETNFYDKIEEIKTAWGVAPAIVINDGFNGSVTLEANDGLTTKVYQWTNNVVSPLPELYN